MTKSILKQLPAVILIAAFVVTEFNCDDSGVISENQQLCISGQVANWTLGTKTLEAKMMSVTNYNYVIATSTIDAEGKFNICLPKTVADTSLFSSDSIFSLGCSGGNVTFNPPDVKGTQIWNLMVYDGSTLLGYLVKKNYTTIFVGAFSLMFVYVNKNTTVTGWEYCFPGDTSVFNGTASSGWNKIVKNCTAINGTHKTYLYNTSEPNGGIWKLDTLPYR